MSALSKSDRLIHFHSSAAFLLLLLISVACERHANAADEAPVLNVSTGGVGYVTLGISSLGINADIGRWDTPYPGPFTPVDVLHSLEPLGESAFYVDVAVNAGGTVKFDYSIETYDTGEWDWLDIYAITPDGTEEIVMNVARPGTVPWTYWNSGRRSAAFDLSPWRNQNVRFVFVVMQDGWGDQTRAQIFDFRVTPGCSISPLAELTDPTAIEFEQHNGSVFNFSGMTVETREAYTCLSSAVTEAGGTPTGTSGYRPPAYQAHLLDVWLKWQELRLNSEQVCAALKSSVYDEALKHGLLGLRMRPAGPSGAHTQGLAFDMTWGPDIRNNILPDGDAIDELANKCEAERPSRTIQNDPVHFEPL